MIIEKIHIDTFGKLSDFDLTLSEGMNIIEGANESGKSTIAAFIRFVLYGIPSKQRSEVLSWQSGGASGSLSVFTGGKRYRIERAVVGSREAVQLIDGDNNMPIRHALDGTTPGELFLGVGADMFSATAFVSQLGGTISGGAKVSEGIENILFSGDEGVNTQRALTKLDSARASLLHKNEKGGKLFELNEDCAQMEMRLSSALKAHEEIMKQEARLSDSREKFAEAKDKSDSIGAKIKQFEINGLLGLFERKHEMEAKVTELRERVEAAGDSDKERLSALESHINRIAMLEKELEASEQRLEQEPVTETSPQVDEYISLGGREGLTRRCDGLRARGMAYLGVGIVMLIFALAALAVGLIPLIGAGQPNIMFTVIGGGLLAFALTLFVLSARARAQRADILEEYDFNDLDRAVKQREAELERAKFADLAAMESKRRYEEAVTLAKSEFGCDITELEARAAQLRERIGEAAAVRADYDKHRSLLSQLNGQLSGYNEEELRRQLDMSVDLSDIEADRLPELRREAEFALTLSQSLEKHITELEKTLAGLYPTAEDPTELTDKLADMKLRRTELMKKYEAYKLAYEKLTEAGESLRSGVSPKLAAESAQLMGYITSGKYSELGVGAALDMTARTEMGMKPLSVLSAGTQDAAYLSLRMALISLLYRKSKPTMVYDESFIRQDGDRLASLLKLVAMQEMQSIIFTANAREAEIMRDIGEFNHITL